MAIIHISEAEAARDLPGLLAKVRAGEEIRIDSGAETVAVIKAPGMDAKPRTTSEAIRRSKERGSTITLDEQWGRDLEEIIEMHSNERLIDPWESF